jgi:hypothetical protein
MSFHPTFVVLRREAFLICGSLSLGLTGLRTATFSDQAKLYAGLLNVSAALERLMKLAIVTDYMLRNNFAMPTESEVTSDGDDLLSMYGACINLAKHHHIADVSAPLVPSVEDEMLKFFSEYCSYTSYGNLEAQKFMLNVGADPVCRWAHLLNMVSAGKVAARKANAGTAARAAGNESEEDSVHAIQNCTDVNLLPLDQLFAMPARHARATPQAMVHVIKMFYPLFTLMRELGYIGFYGPPRCVEPQIPLYGEFFLQFRAPDAEILRKRRWP